LEDVVLDEFRVSNEALELEGLGFFNRFSLVEPGGNATTTWGETKR